MQAILRQKEEKAIQLHKSNDCDQELESQISRTKSKICELFAQVGYASNVGRYRFGLKKLANVSGVPELRHNLKNLAGLEALRGAAQR